MDGYYTIVNMKMGDGSACVFIHNLTCLVRLMYAGGKFKCRRAPKWQKLILSNNYRK
jgi:hypothetical protein